MMTSGIETGNSNLENRKPRIINDSMPRYPDDPMARWSDVPTPRVVGDPMNNAMYTCHPVNKERRISNHQRMAMRKYFFAVFLAAAASLIPAAAQKEPFTIEQVMSAPFPSELVAAPAGGMVAWVFDARGVRNIWVAEPPDYKARALTSYAADDGQEIAELAWTHDARAVVYARGGDFETMREAPNPRSFPQGVEQDVWVVALAGGPPR